MSMSPGTERAIMKISEMMPCLVKAINDLTKGLDARRPKDKKSEITLNITLTAEEWQEVANAVSIRHLQVKRDEPADVDMSEDQIKVWVDTLESAYNKITKVLDQHDLIY